MSRTFIMVKPDGFKDRLVGEVISRFEKAGFGLKALKMVKASKELLRKHYSEHVEKPFYPGLEAFIMEGPVVAMILESENAVAKAREICGSTDPSQAESGTIRGDFSDDSGEKADSEGRAIRNVVHASGSDEEAEKEINLWFSKEEIIG
jgi:nucleoside-diphosphate kinase